MGEKFGWDQILRWREQGFDPEAEMRHLQASQDTLKERVRDLEEHVRFLEGQIRAMDAALEAAREAPPEIAKLVGRLPRCPSCGANVEWAKRSCCRLGQLVGQAEARLVADAVMGEG